MSNGHCKQILIWCLVVWLSATGSIHTIAAPNAPLPQHIPFVPNKTACAPGWIRPVGSTPAVGSTATNNTAQSSQPDRFYPYGSTGQGQYPVHHGVEFVSPVGTPVWAVANGTVVVAGTDRLTSWGPFEEYYGQLIVLELDERCDDRPVYALYGHLAKIQVRLGQRVGQGEVIGQVGMSGIAIGPHLHFEVRVGSNAFDHTQNPELWFAPLPGYGSLVGRVIDADQHWLEGQLITIHRGEQPERYWREAWTYIDMHDEHLNSDERWLENWAVGDVPAGDYVLRLRVNGRLYTHQARVADGQTTFVQFIVLAKNLPKQGPNGIMLSP
ncbi:MAG: M23 family metallopeptidase [Anaerolineae bacterium]|nr:M23 family metallopeptidase [Anaerolineae bacterium]